MICANCGAATPTAPCTSCDVDPTLAGRYQLEANIGTGASGATYRARRVDDDRLVAIKERVFAQQPDLKAWELFEREWKVLRELRHPRIPAYIEHLEQGEGRRFALYIVTELIEGTTLERELDARRFSAEEAIDCAIEVLAILEYLHGLSPPVIHRDIKPANLMRGPDGHLFVIDFGSVRATLEPSDTPTVAGTFGFMAPEQLRGDAEPRSDLYAVGALLLAILTREDPATLQTPNGWNWRSHTKVSESLAKTIDDLLANQAEERPTSARAVIERLSATPEVTGEVPTTQALVPRGSVAMALTLTDENRRYADRLVDRLVGSSRGEKADVHEIRSLMFDQAVPAEQRRDLVEYAKNRYHRQMAPARRRAINIGGAAMVGVGSSIVLATWLWGSFQALSTALFFGGGIAGLWMIVMVLNALGFIYPTDDQQEG